MLKLVRTLVMVLSTAALSFSCASQSTGTSTGAVNCFDTGTGVRCVETFSDILSDDAQDVDGDGEEDPFVCGDVPSDSDSDGDGGDEGDDSDADDDTGEE